MSDIENDGWQWSFPPCKRWIPTDQYTRRQQSLKIIEEAKEVMMAHHGCSVFYAMELLDTIHSCETALREFPDDFIIAAKQAVVNNNAERGYYDDLRNMREVLTLPEEARPY